MLKHYILIARPDHWVKHIFVLPGLLLALGLGAPSVAFTDITKNILLGFLSAFLVASANYAINEWLDAETDKNHPEKHRPAVAGLIKAEWVCVEYCVLTFSGLFLASFINQLFFLTCLAFLFSGIVYNVKPLRIKDRVYFDVIVESFNNPIRLFLGWAMVSNNTVPPISLICTYWAVGAFLMASKRKSEYELIVRKAGIESVAKYRESFRLYTETR